jgi:hypothetical protein
LTEQDTRQAPDPLTIEEAAALMPPWITVGTLRYMRNTGTGPRSYLLARKIVYDRADVEAWLADQKRTTARGAEPVEAAS